MFIRTKKVKGYEYAYLVSNKLSRGKVKQKSRKYLGRVYRFDRKESDFFDIYTIVDVMGHIKEKKSSEIIKEIVEWELYNHGFKQKEGIWRKDECFVDTAKKKVYNKKNSKAALAFNEGYLCEYGIRRLINFRKKNDESDVYRLAKLFVETGLNVPKEVFVGLCSKEGLSRL
ncbi:hypothetical protein GF336_01010 [Candidatus Woesearchaeota archaeon]|nr:hypothetical protein [Candidatus Woesearchaeota archaeon]